MSHSAVPTSVTDSVLQSSEPVPEGSHVVSGVDFDKFQGRDITVAEMVDNMAHTGFQGSAVAEAASIINEMVIPPSYYTFQGELKFNV
jgi:deoxyhypusine synthase